MAVEEIHYLSTESGDLWATEEHPFWQQGTGWVEAKEITTQYPLALLAGDSRPTGNMPVVRHQRVNVYNFTVEPANNYFVSEAGFWVHNALSECAQKLLNGDSGKLADALDPDNVYGDKEGSSSRGKNGWRAHHLIQSAEAKDSKLLQDLAAKGLYDQNDASNGWMLPTEGGRHSTKRLIYPTNCLCISVVIMVRIPDWR